MASQTNIEVRAARPGDDIAVAAMIADYAADYEYELGAQDVVSEGVKAREYYESGALYVAAVDDELVGCVAYEPWGEGRARMKRLYVLREARGKGIGRLLAQAIVDGARKDGNKTMVLDTTKGMVEARALYASMGFEVWDADYEAPCVDTVYMRKAL